MHCASYAISPNDLWNLIGSANAPQLIDVRRRDVYDAASGVLPAARWRDFASVAEWRADIDRRQPVVVACKEGKELSQIAASHLRSEGFDASVLAGARNSLSVAAGTTRTDTLAAPVAPSLSVAVSVITCGPGVKVAVASWPAPSAPSTSDVHASCDSLKEDASSGSMAPPANASGSPALTIAPSGGDVIRAVGALRATLKMTPAKPMSMPSAT